MTCGTAFAIAKTMILIMMIMIIMMMITVGFCHGQNVTEDQVINIVALIVLACREVRKTKNPNL